jgi:dipeptidyl aminopeptidase/acylaminoacyl peptidase
VRQKKAGQPLPQPPANLFSIVHYDSPAGKLAAYLTPDPGDGARHPAIVWITGGDCNTIDDAIWQEQPPENEQSASAFRKAGIVQMFPSLRGGNSNPGSKEGFFGEVDDVLGAAQFLTRQEYVDPQRIYLGGHSSGGTLVLLVAAAASDRFRAVFSFGPADDLHKYGTEYQPFDTSNAREFELRAPARWLHP